jgi:hypothetical protein
MAAVYQDAYPIKLKAMGVSFANSATSSEPILPYELSKLACCQCFVINLGSWVTADVSDG